MRDPTNQYWGRVLGGALLVLAVLMMFVRPTAQWVLSPAETHAARVDENEDEDEEERVSLSQEAQIAAAAQLTAPIPPDQQAQGILAGPEDYEQKLSVARAAVAQDPRRVAQVVRGWVSDGQQ